MTGHRKVLSHPLTLPSVIMSSLQPYPPASLNLFSVTMVLSLRKCDMKGIIQCVPFMTGFFLSV